MAKAKAHPTQTRRLRLDNPGSPGLSVRHPVVNAIQARPQWEPRPFTRLVSRVSAGTRAIADATNPREREWHLITERSLASDLPIWAVLGDSISQGLGSTTLGRSWVARIAGALEADGRPVAIVNLSRSGARAHHVAEEQLELLRLVGNDVVMVSCGVGSNDMMRNPHPPAVAARVRQVIERLPIGSVISTLPAPSISPSGRWVNRTVRRAATEAGVEVADVVPHLLTSFAGLAADRFHPSDAGYEAWVRAYCAVLDLDPAAVPEEWEPPRV